LILYISLIKSVNVKTHNIRSRCLDHSVV